VAKHVCTENNVSEGLKRFKARGRPSLWGWPMGFESSKTLCGVGAIFVALGSFIPPLGLVGIILVLVGLKGLAGFYCEPLIFLDVLCGFIFGVMAFVAAIFALIYFLGGFVSALARPFCFSLLCTILILAAVFAFFLLEALFQGPCAEVGREAVRYGWDVATGRRGAYGSWLWASCSCSPHG